MQTRVAVAAVGNVTCGAARPGDPDPPRIVLGLFPSGRRRATCRSTYWPANRDLPCKSVVTEFTHPTGVAALFVAEEPKGDAQELVRLVVALKTCNVQEVSIRRPGSGGSLKAG
jgi:hypothetical protein